MERLTTDSAYLADKEEYERHLAQGYPRSIPRERFLRLCEYERTNLTPEQIVEIDKLYRKKCEELERLKKYLPAFRIGDTAYLVDFDAGTFDKSVVNGIVSRVDGDTAKFDYDSDLLDFCDTDIGVCVFRSETEAQEALERMVQND